MRVRKKVKNGYREKKASLKFYKEEIVIGRSYGPLACDYQIHENEWKNVVALETNQILLFFTIQFTNQM